MKEFIATTAHLPIGTCVLNLPSIQIDERWLNSDDVSAVKEMLNGELELGKDPHYFFGGIMSSTCRLTK